jgi:hypothetical protein
MKRVALNARSVCSLGIISLFVLFLASSAPHRVHHLFENLSHESKPNAATAQLVTTKVPAKSHHHHSSDHSSSPHEHGHHAEVSHATTDGHERQEDRSAQSDCVAQTVAQNSHVLLVELSTTDLLTAELDCLLTDSASSFAGFNPSPFSQRAPPRV